ncbi:DUF1534 domain-containing protein, partial [Pseudomonas syringae]|nr:DUF1534 domain-containing protein [Pseudomonas syringae]
MAGIFKIGRDACLRDAARHKSTPPAQDRTQSLARKLRLSFLTLQRGNAVLDALRPAHWRERQQHLAWRVTSITA